METTQAAVSRRALVSLVTHLTGGYPNDFDSPQPPGPWDPVLRRALDRVRMFGARPDPWRVFGPLPDPWRSTAPALERLSWTALNPLPLPPVGIVLAAALADEMIDRTSLLYELADAFPEETRGHVQGAARGQLEQLVDDLCGNDMRWWPFPVPPAGGDGAPATIGAAELVMMGAQFERAAALLASEQLRHDVARAGVRLFEAGLERLR